MKKNAERITNTVMDDAFDFFRDTTESNAKHCIYSSCQQWVRSSRDRLQCMHHLPTLWGPRMKERLCTVPSCSRYEQSHLPSAECDNKQEASRRPHSLALKETSLDL